MAEQGKLERINQEESGEEVTLTSTKKDIITKSKNNRMMLSKLHVEQGVKKKMASLAIHLKARLRSADMPLTMQERALSFTRSFLDAQPMKNKGRLNPSQLAHALKKEFDTRYGAVWHCIVGKSYGSYVTHSAGGFLYFSFDSHFVLLFKTQVHVLRPTSPTKS